MSFSADIKKIRTGLMLSQTDFGKLLGVDYSTINRWENGKSVPQIGMLKRINEFCLANKIPVDVTSIICPDVINETQISIKEAE